MTLRAAFLGLLGAVFICGVTYFNDNVMRQTLFTGNNMPLSVFGGIVLFVLLVNPLLKLMSRRMLVSAITLAAACLVAVTVHVAVGSVPSPGVGLNVVRGLVAGLFGGIMLCVVIANPFSRIDAENRLPAVAGVGAASLLLLVLILVPALAFMRPVTITLLGGSLMYLLTANPYFERMRGSGSLTAKELSLALAVTLSACVVPSSGLMRTFTTTLMVPHRYHRNNPSWRREGVIEMTPGRMLAEVPAGRDGEEKVLTGFERGLNKPKVGLGDIPWHAWRRTLLFWIPLIILPLWIGLIALSVVVHRQWADHEQLPYPVARFADALLPGKGETKGAVFRNRFFWVGLGVVLAIHVNNYAFIWFPDLVQIPLKVDFSPFLPLFPTFRRGEWTSFVMNPTFYFTAVAFAYFLATDASFSLGISTYVWAMATGIMATFGVTASYGGYYHPNIQGLFAAGAFLGMLLAILYTGRRYYVSVLRRALMLKAQDEVESHAIWGARVFLLCMLIFMANLVALDLDWPIALLYTGGSVMIFLVLGRIIAETGIFFMQARFLPCAAIVGLLGARALGPRTMLIMFLITAVILVDPREAIFSFMVNSLKIVDQRGVKIGRTALLCVGAVVLGLAVALPVTLWFQYSRGMDRSDGWSTRSVPTMHYDEVIKTKQRLKAQGSLEQSESVSGLGRFLVISPPRGCLVAFIAGLTLVILFTVARLRFAKWPLHAVMFLTMYSYPMATFASSFLVGWLIKVAVMKYGGESAHRKVMPLMFGLIAGDMLGGVVTTAVGALYYWVTGEPPKSFNIMPV